MKNNPFLIRKYEPNHLPLFHHLNETEIMTTQINNIAELAAELVISGKATIENAFQMALDLDNDMVLKSIEDIRDMQNGYKNDENKTQKAFGILIGSVYSKLRRKCDCDCFSVKTDNEGFCKKCCKNLGFVRQ